MKIYFMGICGTAMGNVALMLKKEGHDIYGADSGIYPPMSDLLEASDIQLFDGYNPRQLEELEPDLVVVGNVVSRGHPEMEWLLETRRFKYVSLPALLHELILSKRRNIVVGGTHGKTTTSTLTAFLLANNDATPGYLIGGVPCDLPGGAEPGTDGGPFVIEGDEYDSAFFDKRSKFIHYLPNILVLNNLEFDHADIFRDLEDVMRTFRHVTRLVPRNGFILVNEEDENLKSLLPLDWTQVLTVGLGDSADLQIRNFRESSSGSEFELVWKGKSWARINWKQRGLYNARNAAMASLAAGLMVYPENPVSLKLEALAEFKGVKRRQELLYEDDRLLVFEDFGHHPSAIKDTLTSLRACYPGAHISACFEPRSNTARTQVFQESLPGAFKDANRIYLGAVHRADKLTADERLDTDRIIREVNEIKGSECAEYFSENKLLLEAALKQFRESDSPLNLFCFFSNGSFDGIMKDFVDSAAAIKGS